MCTGWRFTLGPQVTFKLGVICDIMLFILFAWYLDLGLLGVSISLSISTFLLFLQLLIIAQKYNPNVKTIKKSQSKKKLLKEIWNYGQWSYYSSFIEFIFQQFPILFLKSSVSSFFQIGIFGKAIGLANYPKIAAIPLSGLLFSYNAGSSNEIAAKRTELLCRLVFNIITITRKKVTF